MTIGKKIALGFASLILISTLLGGLAVYNMRAVQSQSQKLATEYIPEARIAGDLGNALSGVQLGVRSYGLTADPVHLDATRKNLAEMHKQQQAAQKLADEHPDLSSSHFGWSYQGLGGGLRVQDAGEGGNGRLV